VQALSPLTGTALRLAMLAVALGTFVSVVTGTIVSVPLRDIANDLHVSIAAASLILTGSNLAFGSLMPLGGWLGNRFGHRRVFIFGNTALALTGLAGAFAPNLSTLVVLRVVQGASSATITPCVIAMLASLVAPPERPRALANWAMANGMGQALGPPLGGLIAGALGWRSIFIPGALIAVGVIVMALRYVPVEGGRTIPLEWRGALALTSAALLSLGAASAVPQAGILAPGVLVGFGLALVSLMLFLRQTYRSEHPFVSPGVFREPSYLRACIGVTTGTFSLGTALLTIPLYLTRVIGVSTAQAGLIAFAFPLAMVLSAQPVGYLIRRFGVSNGMRVGLLGLTTICVALWWGCDHLIPIVIFVPLIFAAGIGLAFVHNAAAVASTASAAARYGAGVGMFNLIRVFGTTLGTVSVAAILASDPSRFGFAFSVSAIVALFGFLVMMVIPPDVVAEPVHVSTA